jgi:hypothetical protein
MDEFEDLHLISSPTAGVLCKIMKNSRFFFRNTDSERFVKSWICSFFFFFIFDLVCDLACDLVCEFGL